MKPIVDSNSGHSNIAGSPAEPAGRSRIRVQLRQGVCRAPNPETVPSKDPTVGQGLGPYGGPREGGCFF